MAIRHFLSHLAKYDPPPISGSSSKLSTSSLFPAPLHLHLPPRRPPFKSSSTTSPSTSTHAAYSSAAQGGIEEHSSSRGGSGWMGGGGWEGGGGLEGRRRLEESKQTTSWTTLDGRRKLRGFKPQQQREEGSIPHKEEEVLLDPWPSKPTRGTDVPPPRPRPSRSTPPLQPHPFQHRPSQPASSRIDLHQDTIVPLPTTISTHLDLSSSSLTPPSAHPVNSPPVLDLLPPSLESSLESLLSSPTISLEGLGIASADFSLALQLLGSQTSSFSTLEMEEEATLTLEEVNELNRRRETCARMVLKLAGERTVHLSAVDEYWVARARLQLGSSVSAIPRSSYIFSSDGTLSLHVPFFRTLLSPTSTRLQSFEAVHHFTHLLARLSSLVQVGTNPILPRQDVLAILDLILERIRTLNDLNSLDLILPALLNRRRRRDQHDQEVSFFVRRILQTFDGSSRSSNRQSMAVYTKILDHDASSYLGSAALCQFGLSLSDLKDASQVLEDPQLSSRHFHLLAYRIVLAVEKTIPSSIESARVYNASRLARPFRRMGADPSRPRRPLSVDLRDRIVDLLSRYRDKSVAAWIVLNHPTIPVASSSASNYNTIIDLDSSSSSTNSLPPSPIEFAPLPLPLAEQLLLILCQRRREEDLLLAISILQTIPPKDQTIKLYNLLLRHTFLVLWHRNEADACSSLLYSLLASSPPSPTLRPNLQTLEAQLLAPPKSFDLKSRRRSDEEMSEVASFRRAAFDGFFALVMERGGEFRKRTWELLVAAVTKECGYEKGKEAVGWMRLAGFEPDEEGTTWGEQVLRKVDAWDNAHRPDVGVQELVIELMETEGMKHGRHSYAALLDRVVHSNLGTSKHLRHLFLTDFVARSFPGTSWITLDSIPPTSSPKTLTAETSTSFEPIIDVSRTSRPTQVHLTLSLNPTHRPLPPHLLRASTSASAVPPLDPSSSYPSMHDLQPPSNWSDWDPPSSAGGLSFERDAAPMLSMLMGRFKKDGDHEFVEIVHLCLQHGREEELKRKREEEGLEWWEGGWEWEDEWREGRTTRREGRLNDELEFVE